MNCNPEKIKYNDTHANKPIKNNTDTIGFLLIIVYTAKSIEPKEIIERKLVSLLVVYEEVTLYIIWYSYIYYLDVADNRNNTVKRKLDKNKAKIRKFTKTLNLNRCIIL